MSRERTYHGRPVLYPTRALMPAVWLRHQPRMSRVLRIDRRYGSIQIQWRWPLEGGRCHGFVLSVQRRLTARSR